MKKNKAHYKWGKLFASMRYNTTDGVISLTPLEQQELLDDLSSLVDSPNCVCAGGKTGRTVDENFEQICDTCGKI